MPKSEFPGDRVRPAGVRPSLRQAESGRSRWHNGGLDAGTGVGISDYNHTHAGYETFKIERVTNTRVLPPALVTMRAAIVHMAAALAAALFGLGSALQTMVRCFDILLSRQ